MNWCINRYLVVAGISLCCLAADATNPAIAQINSDGTLPTNVTQTGNVWEITGGAQAGSNLFHSFSEFSVPTGNTAYFNNGVSIENIFSRVTGSSVSNIDGLIRANGTANLFLLNPNGILFGPNASLNIGGSFVGTTANAIGFGNQGVFSASTPNAPTSLLTVNPSAFLFNQISRGGIVNNSVAPAGQHPAEFDLFGLRVPDGKSLVLLGGNVSIDGGEVNAVGGRVELGGLAEAGTVGLTIDGNNLSLSFPVGVARGDVALTNSAVVDVTSGGGGSIAVNAGNLDVLRFSGLFAGIASDLGSAGTQAGDITLNATGKITITGSSISNQVEFGATGNGGNINIKAGSVSFTNASINTPSSAQGNSGNIFIQADDSVSIISGGISSILGFDAVGNGGDINIKARSLSLTEGAQLRTDTYGQGNGGNVTIQASDTVSITGELPLWRTPSGIFSTVRPVPGFIGDRKGGDINISAGSISIGERNFLNTTSFGGANAGSIFLQANDSISLSNRAQLTASTLGQGNAGSVSLQANSVTLNNSFISSNVGDTAVGQGGNIQIQAGSLSLANQAQLDANTLGQGNAGSVSLQANSVILNNSFISSNVEDTAVGQGGDIKIQSGSLSLTNNAQLDASTFGQGNAGRIFLIANDSISLTGGGTIIFNNVESTGVGNAGGIRIEAGSLSLTDGAQALASTLGQGNAGNVSVDVRNTVTFAGTSGDSPSGIASTVEPGAIGNGGDINIKAGAFFLTNGAKVSASTLSQGNGGNVFIQANSSVSLAGKETTILSSIASGGVGEGGDINIQAGSLSITDDAQLLTIIRRASDSRPAGRGNGGSVNIDVRDNVTIVAANNGLFTGIASTVDQGASGRAGDINIKTGSLSLTGSTAQLQAGIAGQGEAGRVFVQARDSMSLTNGSAILSTVEFGAVGKANNIEIETGSLSLNGGQLASSTEGQGNAGNISIQANNFVSLAGARTGIFSGVSSEAVGQGGNIDIQSPFLSLTDSAFLTSATNGQGNAGNIAVGVEKLVVQNGAFIEAETVSDSRGGNLKVTASDSVEVRGTSADSSASSSLSTASRGNGSAGNLTITTGKLLVQDGAQIGAGAFSGGQGGQLNVTASNKVELMGTSPDGFPSGLFTQTQGAGAAGNLTITTGNLIVRNGANVGAGSFSEGQGGQLSVIASDKVELIGTSPDGSPSSLSTQTLGTGIAGNIAITTSQLTVRDNAQIAVNSLGLNSGKAGDLNITADSILLDRQGKLIAQTDAGDGGNITLNVQDLLLMRRNSEISTTAGTANQGGNGGNITINSPFIVAVPKENSDITANAFTGNGGNINITTQGIYGLQFRPRRTPKSDITASSDFGVNGTVLINSAFDVTQSVTNLPVDLVDASNQIDQTCTPAGAQDRENNRFIITGRGGMPPSPNEPLQAESVITPDWVNVDSQEDKQSTTNTSGDRTTRIPPTTPTKPALVEAQGWVYGTNGEIILTASAPTVTPQTPSVKPAACSGGDSDSPR